MTTTSTDTTAARPLRPAAQPKMSWGAVLSTLGPLLGLVLVFCTFAILRPRTFLTTSNYEVMLLQTAVVGIAALGMTLVIISGGIDLSVGSNIAMVTVVVALLLRNGASPLLAAMGGVAAAGVWGVVIGLMVTQLRLPPFIATLGLWGAVRGVAKGMADQRVVSAPETWLNSLLVSLGPDQRWMLVPPGVWLMIVLSIVVWAILRYTRFGRHIFAVGSNEQTARLCGVNVARTKILIYLTAGALAGVAGVLQFSYLGLGDPTTANGLELNIIAAVVIGGASLSGGQGTVLGTITGALLMTIVATGSTKMGWENWRQEIITGGIIILASAVDQLRQRRAG
jgi:ribose/xylose/arabinose/galactoside ABC-type transport system permease subunit